MTEHTPIRQVSRLEVISTGARRRWTLEEKQRIVAESYGGPRLVSATARRHGLSVSQLFTWRRLAREGRLAEQADVAAGFAPAIIRRDPSPDDPPSPVGAVANSMATACPIAAPGRIEIVLKHGHRVIVDNGVDPRMLAQVLAVLER